jgi:hypothetical protein
MADPQPTINLHVNLGNATQEIDRFGYALSRVDQKARGIYATLRELSERYKEQGFLGMADQRALERGMQSWQRAGELLDLQRRGAATRLQEMRLRAPGDPAEDPRVLAAERALSRIQGQKLGRDILQQDIAQGVLAGMVPGPTNLIANRPPTGLPHGPGSAPAPQFLGRFTPWTRYPGAGTFPPSGPVSPWGPPPMPPPPPLRGQTSAWVPPSTRPAGPYTSWTPGATSPYPWSPWPHVPTPPSGPSSPWTPPPGTPFWPPTPPAPVSPWSPPSVQPTGPFSPWPHTGGPGGPFTPWGPGMVGGPGGHLAAAWMGSGWRGSGGMGGGIEAGVGAVAPWLARGAGMVAGLGAAGVGYSAYKLLSEGMQAYETRAMGVIKLGGQMNQEYGDLDETIKGVREEFKMLAKDSVDMMGIMVRSTGQAERGTVRRLAGFALAHGMSGAEVATNYGTLARYGADRTPNMAVIEAIRREGVAAGGTVLPTADFQSAVARMATVGGTALLPMGEVERTRYATMMGLFGQKYGADPAQAFAEFAAGAGGPKSTMGEVVLGLGLEDIRRRNPILNIGDPNKGGMRLNLNNYNDWLIAKEQAGLSPDIQEAVYGRAAGMAGGNRQLQEALFGGGMGITTATGTRQILLGFEEARRQGGGTIPDYVQRPASPVVADEAEKARLDILRSNKELWNTLDLAVQGEVTSEKGFIAQLRNMRLELEKTANTVADARSPIEALTKVYQGLSSETQVLIGLGAIGLGLIPSPASPYLVGTGLLGVGSGTTKALNEHGTEEERKRQQQTGPRKPAP